jgi:hypothetical protein
MATPARRAPRSILTSCGTAAGTVTVRPRISTGIASEAASTTIHAHHLKVRTSHPEYPQAEPHREAKQQGSQSGFNE